MKTTVKVIKTGYEFHCGGNVFRSAPYDCRIIGADGSVAHFADADCRSEVYNTGAGSGVRQIWSTFPGFPGVTLECRIWAEDVSGDVLFELVPLCDAEIEEIVWPAPFENNEKGAYSVVPLMQGALIPNYTAERFPDAWDIITDYTEYRHTCSRSMYMPFYGQYDAHGGCMTIFETPFDGAMTVESGAGKPVLCVPKHRESLGVIGYTRRLRVRFFAAGADYNDIAKAYRAYLQSRGTLRTLAEKAACNPKVDDLIGRAVVHTHAWYHTVPESKMYNPDRPEANDSIQTFDAVGNLLTDLKKKGLENAALHLDGWGRRGYDNQHPDYLPPAEVCGGWEGFKRLCDTCRSLGYFFGLHDQYRDFFYDADTFDESLAVHNRDGGVYTHAIWMGGKQTFLCATQAPYYVKRNYTQLREQGVVPDNVYLDVFSCVELDECYHPSHRMTREACAEYRMECFRYLEQNGILAQSEEGIDWAFPGLVFLHHAPFAPQSFPNGEKTGGIRIPLLALVYHDCVITPYDTGKEGALYGYLLGSAAYVDPTASADEVAACNRRLAWQKLVQKKEILRHEFVGGNVNVQKTLFAGGYAAEVDFEKGTWQLTYPD